MIERYVFGTPLPTGSTVLSIPPEPAGRLPGCLLCLPDIRTSNDRWLYPMDADTAVYGLGEMPRGINKRGWHYVTNNTDESHHGENKLSYYGAHNFLLVKGGAGCMDFGVFIDFPGKVYYDIGYTDHERLEFHTETPDYELYFITGDDPDDNLPAVPAAHRPQLHPAQVGFRVCAEPLGLQDRRRCARGRAAVPPERPAVGHGLSGHRLYAGLR